MSAENTLRWGENRLEKRQSGELGIRIGENANIELLGSGERLWGEVVGMKAGIFLALLVPALKTEKSRRTFLGEGMVAVRCMTGGCDLVGFKTTVSHVLQGPYPLLFLDHPETFERVNLRKSERVGVRIESRIFHDAAELSGTIVDISAGGAKVAVNGAAALNLSELGVESECVMMFELGEKAGERCVRSSVRNLVKNGRDVLIGLQFVSIEDDALEDIERFISRAKR